MKPRPATPQVQDQVRQLVHARGTAGAAKALALAPATIARLAAGLPVSLGTEALAQARLSADGSDSGNSGAPSTP